MLAPTPQTATFRGKIRYIAVGGPRPASNVLLRRVLHHYFSRSHTTLATTVFPGCNRLGAGGVSSISFSPSNLKWSLCSVPFHASFHETSTAVMKSLPSIRYFPL